MHDLTNDNEYLWERNKFLNRQSYMQELYRQFEETGELAQVDKVRYRDNEISDKCWDKKFVIVTLEYVAQIL